MSAVEVRGIRYVAEPGFEEAIDHAPETLGVYAEAAEAAFRGALQAAPEATGRYRRSLAVDLTSGRPRLISTSPFWHFVEYGTAKNPPHAPLRRGIEASGCDFRDEGHGGE